VLVATWIAMCGAMVYTDPRLWVVVASSAVRSSASRPRG